MSWSRSRYDACSYNKELRQSTGVLDYLLDPNKFYNCNPCRTELGIFAGNNVSLSKDNLVNVESDLRNQTRQLSRCPERKYLPECAEGCDCNEGLPCGSDSCRDREPRDHLPTCNIIQYPPRVDHVGYSLKYPGCPVENTPSIDGQPMKFQPYINPIQFSDAAAGVKQVVDGASKACNVAENRYGAGN